MQVLPFGIRGAFLTGLIQSRLALSQPSPTPSEVSDKSDKNLLRDALNIQKNSILRKSTTRYGSVLLKRLAVNKAKTAPKGKSEFLWGLHMGTFRKLLLILPSRRLKVRLISFYKQKVGYVTNITKTANSVKRILGISFRPKFRQKILDAPTYWGCFCVGMWDALYIWSFRFH